VISVELCSDAANVMLVNSKRNRSNEASRVFDGGEEEMGGMERSWTALPLKTYCNVFDNGEGLSQQLCRMLVEGVGKD
jgi:hypothetical protein